MQMNCMSEDFFPITGKSHEKKRFSFFGDETNLVLYERLNLKYFYIS